ncbi:MAG: hypothetical protein QXE80_09135 [Pyrobaculum sp.]
MVLKGANFELEFQLDETLFKNMMQFRLAYVYKVKSFKSENNIELQEPLLRVESYVLDKEIDDNILISNTELDEKTLLSRLPEKFKVYTDEVVFEIKKEEEANNQYVAKIDSVFSINKLPRTLSLIVAHIIFDAKTIMQMVEIINKLFPVAEAVYNQLLKNPTSFKYELDEPIQFEGKTFDHVYSDKMLFDIRNIRYSFRTPYIFKRDLIESFVANVVLKLLND